MEMDGMRVLFEFGLGVALLGAAVAGAIAFLYSAFFDK